jgi:SAM-dependent methyltransferase
MSPGSSRASAPGRPDRGVSRAVFEELAGRYDAWYDTPQGRLLFGLELACVAPLLAETPYPRLEVGVGPGRFAAALGLDIGLDPAAVPLRLASDRGVRAVRGTGEQLPFANGAFGAVVVVVTICFADDPAMLVREARRVLRPGGKLVLGAVPADSAWGCSYQDKGRSGHSFYRFAHFSTLAEHRQLLEDGGFELTAARSTLLQAPPDVLLEEPVREGALPGAGFVALAARAA